MPPNLKRGIAYLKTELKTLPSQPGVYRMQNAAGEVLYVGKARNLVRRVTNYTQPNRLSNRIMRMVGETQKLEVIVTKSEIEALLLESNLIKKMQPRYNILLRDDKSLPQILLTDDHEFGQLTKHRGRKTAKAIISGHLPRPDRSTAPWPTLPAPLCFAPVLTTCLQVARAPVCNIRSNVAQGPVLGLLAAKITSSKWRKPAVS